MDNRSTIVIPPKPEPLSIYRLHTPEEVKRHKAEAQAYWEAVRAKQLADEREAEAKVAYENRVLSEAEYYEQAVERMNQQRAKDLAREAEALAARREHEEYLASQPEVAEVCTNAFGTFLTEYAHWCRLGYELDVSGPLTALPSLFHCTLKRPTTGKAKALH